MVNGILKDFHPALILDNKNLFLQMDKLTIVHKQYKEDTKQQMLIQIMVLDIMEEIVK